MTISLDSLKNKMFRGHSMKQLLKKVPLVVAFWMMSQAGDVAAQDFTPNTLADSITPLPPEPNPPIINTLRDAILAANQSTTDDRIVLQTGEYALSLIGRDENLGRTGDLDITRPSTSGVLTIEGVGPGTVINANEIDRVFHITSGAKVTFKNLKIVGGYATDNGANTTVPPAPGGSSVGGGILSTDGALTFDNVIIENNTASGRSGSITSSSAGTNGGDAYGGGIYAEGGSVTFSGTGSTVRLNYAYGGNGADAAYRGSTSGASGGNGGSAIGGGLFVQSSTLVGTNLTVVDNLAQGGGGGRGADGGASSSTDTIGTSTPSSYTTTFYYAYAGGRGGSGGSAMGAGIFAQGKGGTLNLTASDISSNTNYAGQGGRGGDGGASGSAGGAGGNAGFSGGARGGGLYVSGLDVTLDGTTVSGNSNVGAAPIPGGTGFRDEDGGRGSSNSPVLGGGIFAVYGELNLNSVLVDDNTQTAGSGGNGGNNPTSGWTGQGGTGGYAAGGGIYARLAPITLSGTSSVSRNQNTGGNSAPGEGSWRRFASKAKFSSSSSSLIFFPGDAVGAGIYVSGAGFDAGSATSLTLNQNSNTGGRGSDGLGGSSSSSPSVYQTASSGVPGGDGGHAAGAGMFVYNSTFVASNLVVTKNTNAGGDGGNGEYGTSDGGNGGDGGSATGAGLYIGYTPTVTLTNSTISENTNTGGKGGAGGSGSSGGNGGSGGDSFGGGLFIQVSGQFPITLDASITQTTVASNQNRGGIGGTGGKADPFSTSGSGGRGGSGGEAIGGGVYVSGNFTGGAVAFNNGTVAGNSNIGGAGGIGGDAPSSVGSGGNASNVLGGGIYTQFVDVALNATLVDSNTQTAGNGGAGGVTSSSMRVGSGGRGGDAYGGGAYCYGGSVTVSGTTGITNNSNTGGSGGVNSRGGDAYGGGLGLGYDTPLVSDTAVLTVQGNRNAGGKGGNGGSEGGSSRGNGASGGEAIGGGIFADYNAAITAANLTLVSNSNVGGDGGNGQNAGPFAAGGSGGFGGQASGGGIYSYDTVTLSASVVSNNSNTGGKGGTGGNGGDATTTGLAGPGGRGGNGGYTIGAGIFASYGGAISMSTISGNTQTAGHGGTGGNGGILAPATPAAGGVGGSGGSADGAGLEIGSSAESFSLSNSTLSGNSGTGGNGGAGGMGSIQAGGGYGGSSNGGGIANYAAALVIRSSTISGNRLFSGSAGPGDPNSPFDGGAGSATGGGVLSANNNFGTSVVVANSTIVRNTVSIGTATGLGTGGFAGAGGAHLFAYGGPVRVISTIVAENLSAGTPNDSTMQLDAQSLNNLIGEGTNLTGTIDASNQVGTAASPLDPKLDILDDHGGPTETHALLAGSPAFEKGLANGETLDQRGTGFARVVGTAADVGAFENNAPTSNPGAPYTISELQALTLDGSGSVDPDNNALTYSWDINGDGTFGDATGINPTLTVAQLAALGISDGPATFNVVLQVSDGLFTSTPVQTTLRINNAAPVVAINAPATGQAGTAIDLTQTTTDVPADLTTMTYTWTVSRNGTVVFNGSGASFSFTPAMGGTYEVTVTATDKDGGVGTDTKSITVANVPPVITSTPNITPINPVTGEVITINVPTTDAEGDPLTYTFDWGDGTIETTGQHAYTTPGTYTVTITVFDGTSTTTTTITVTVGAAAKPAEFVPFNLIRLKGGLNFLHTGQDLVRITCDLPNAKDLKVAGQKITLDIGGAKATFTLNDRGLSREKLKDHGGSVSARAKRNGSRRLFFSMLGSWQQHWKDEKVEVPSGNKQVPTTMPVRITIDGKTYGGDVKIFLSPHEGAVWIFDNKFKR
ncbi:MAG TPA: PKD domain-containing protein [Planctomycetota bacterium]|nr:PKD domain-containing protein [Planctomycetota bacterium]